MQKTLDLLQTVDPGNIDGKEDNNVELCVSDSGSPTTSALANLEVGKWARPAP